MKIFRNAFFLGVSAGVMIGIGGGVLLSVDNKYIGAALFAVALLTICALGLNLFTGKVGYLVEDHSRGNFILVLSSLIGNFVGTGLTSGTLMLCSSKLVDTAAAMCEGKLEKNALEIFFSAILCGVLMYVAVHIYKTKGSYLGILFCVPVFILSGFEHSIADMFYFWLSQNYTIKVAGFIALAILGNAVGGCLLPTLKKLSGEE